MLWPPPSTQSPPSFLIKTGLLTKKELLAGLTLLQSHSVPPHQHWWRTGHDLGFEAQSRFWAEIWDEDCVLLKTGILALKVTSQISSVFNFVMLFLGKNRLTRQNKLSKIPFPAQILTKDPSKYSQFECICLLSMLKHMVAPFSLSSLVRFRNQNFQVKVWSCGVFWMVFITHWKLSYIPWLVLAFFTALRPFPSPLHQTFKKSGSWWYMGGGARGGGGRGGGARGVRDTWQTCFPLKTQP